tara:strand:+ start:481 stop:795 length:315 start_codon:yes stop_codon:yes gene_type:complete
MEFIKKVGDKVKIKAEIAKIDIEDEKELVGLIIPGSEDSEIWISRETAIKVGIVKKTVMAKCPNCNGEGTVWYSGHGAFGEDESGNETCKVCSGQGTVEVELLK